MAVPTGPNGGRPQNPAQQAMEEQARAMHDDLQAKLAEIVARNKAGFADLQRRGINIDPTSLIHARIDHLINMVSQLAGPGGALWALQTRLSFEQLAADNIENAKVQGQTAIIAQGAAFTPSMIAQLARDTGTPGWTGH